MLRDLLGNFKALGSGELIQFNPLSFHENVVKSLWTNFLAKLCPLVREAGQHFSWKGRRQEGRVDAFVQEKVEESERSVKGSLHLRQRRAGVAGKKWEFSGQYRWLLRSYCGVASSILRVNSSLIVEAASLETGSFCQNSVFLSSSACIRGMIRIWKNDSISWAAYENGELRAYIISSSKEYYAEGTEGALFMSSHMTSGKKKKRTSLKSFKNLLPHPSFSSS